MFNYPLHNYALNLDEAVSLLSGKGQPFTTEPPLKTTMGKKQSKNVNGKGANAGN